MKKIFIVLGLVVLIWAFVWCPCMDKEKVLKVNVSEIKQDVNILWCNEQFCVQDTGEVCYLDNLKVEEIVWNLK